MKRVLPTQEWLDAQQWETEWHGNCINSYNEETKQFIYARLMGMDGYATNWWGRRGWNFGDKTIVDLGSGPYSILLKCEATKKIAVDPAPYPDWVKARYEAANVDFLQLPAEIYTCGEVVDEVLIYNCLQHTIDPAEIIRQAKSYSKIIRIFEWIDTGTSDGHLHDLHAEDLDRWLGGEGKVGMLNQSPCVGKAYFGIFKGDHHD